MTKFKRSVIATVLIVTGLTAGAAAILPAGSVSHHSQSVASEMGPRVVVKPGF
ncbi:hypothetical protein [Catenulispora yoronensis]|uniref:hypothetical protein n=1 Tax=Catenulispora yoronensis TaxID=450799 RepID=UPI0031D3BE90